MKLLKLTDAEMARLSLPPSISDGGQEESYVQLQRIRVTFPKHFSLYEVDTYDIDTHTVNINYYIWIFSVP